VSSHKFRSVSGSFAGLLMLGEPFDRSLIDKMEDASAGPSSSEIMWEVGIFKGGGKDRIASWSRHVTIQKFLIGFTIDTTIGPIKGDMFHLEVVRNPSMEANSSIRI
jgi:hypothetical protein